MLRGCTLGHLQAFSCHNLPSCLADVHQNGLLRICWYIWKSKVSLLALMSSGLGCGP